MHQFVEVLYTNQEGEAKRAFLCDRGAVFLTQNVFEASAPWFGAILNAKSVESATVHTATEMPRPERSPEGLAAVKAKIEYDRTMLSAEITKLEEARTQMIAERAPK